MIKKVNFKSEAKKILMPKRMIHKENERKTGDGR